MYNVPYIFTHIVKTIVTPCKKGRCFRDSWTGRALVIALQWIHHGAKQLEIHNPQRGTLSMKES